MENSQPPKRVRCHHCNGTGEHWPPRADEPEECAECDGTGEVAATDKTRDEGQP